jgi:flavin-dependent dehydrogenase
VGICGRATTAELKARLGTYLRKRGWEWKDAPFYAHAVPSLDREGFAKNRVAGEGWLAVGDAAGLVDPVTGEGIYYAMRSGELAAEAVLERAGAAETPELYRAALRKDFLDDLTCAAGLAKRFFLQRFLSGTVPGRMIEFMRRSESLRGVVQDLFAGTQDYLSLKPRLLKTMNVSAWETFVSVFAGGQVQEEKG